MWPDRFPAGRLLPRLIAVALFLCLLAPGLALAAGAHQRPRVDGPLRADGHYLRDPSRRVVVLHGLFEVWKRPTIYPDPDPAAVNSFTPADAARIRALGFDAVRLAWFWEGLEPTEGVYDRAYLEKVAATESELAGRGIYVLLDSHQDLYGQRYGSGHGIPDWATDDDGIAFGPPLGFPLDYFSSAVGRAFANLYADSEGQWKAFGRAWQVVAKRFRSDPMVLGYDLINEPWPGEAATNSACISAEGCPDFDRSTLEPSESSLARSIRAVDGRRTVFYEPTIWFNQGRPNYFTRPPKGLWPAGFSFHNQCPTRAAYQVTHDPALIEQGHRTCPPIEAAVMHHADRIARSLGGPPLMTEVAATANEDYEGLNCLLERADHFKTGFTYGLSWNSGELRTLAPEKAQVIARVYPRAIAGMPIHYGFDVRTGRFELSYRTRAGIRGPTVIAVPASVQYPRGYRVRVSGGRVISAAGAGRLKIARARHARRVTVEVRPALGDNTARPSFPRCRLDPPAG